MTKNKCRTCGDTIFIANPKNIFAKEHQAILKNIKNLTGLAFNFKKHLPQHICSCCFLDLQHATLFRERCIKVEKHFDVETKLESPEEDDEEMQQEHYQLNSLDAIMEYKKANELDESLEYKIDNELDENLEFQTVNELEENLEFQTVNELDAIMEYKMINELDAVKSPGKKNSHMSLRSNPSRTSPRVRIKRLPSPEKKAKALSVDQPAEKQLKKRKKRKPYYNTEMKYTCEHCGLTFRDGGNMKQHRRTHSEPTFSCEECGHKFYTQPLLNLHIRVRHKNELPFICKYCGKGFPNSPSRCRHERQNHANELPFKCSICPKTFISKISLDKHIQFHKDGEKPIKFICTTCDKEFVDKPTLNKHYRTKYHLKRLEFGVSEMDEASLDSDGDIDGFDLAETLISEQMDE